MPTHTLELTTPDGWKVSVPCSLPHGLTFSCFIPGKGIMRTDFIPPSLNPLAHQEVSRIDVWWRGRPDVGLTPAEEAAAREQAQSMLLHIMERLAVQVTDMDRQLWEASSTSQREGMVADGNSRAILLLIATLAHAEATAWEAWSTLPPELREKVGRANRPPCPTTPNYPAMPNTNTPSARLMAAFVEHVVEEAQKAAEAREESAAHAARPQA